MLSGIKRFFKERKEDAQDYLGGGKVAKTLGVLFVIYLLVAAVLGIIWSSEPDVFPVRAEAAKTAKDMNRELVTGFTTTSTLIQMTETLLNKSGGYITNDIMPPGLWMDNMPHWEYGVLVQVRDMARAMRKDMSRSQSQSSEDPDLTVAEPQLHFDNGSWVLPSTESEYRRGVAALRRYLDRLSNPQQPQAQFYARADNLNNWLGDLETRLGSLSRKLSESVGKQTVGESGDEMVSDPKDKSYESVQTPWTEIDDVFYEARGTAWALLHIFRAIEVDFREVLIDKNALVSVRQIIVELEGSQEPMWSPVILNGSGFGFLANHSLTMASYLARANSAVVDLRKLLDQG
ncbi:MAG: hypothetical protein CL581_20445 [Alteromonadaceae bacterium]|uniref:DUF2333 family protein n=1 Tax=unclassified Marinobacter TaxID=83889 RepID=UPI000C3E4069|nr:DUF2333 family protein [Marinobacter sp. BGYM27]MAA67132.1 hypothetical protein [Alteromonadaceae bacterium]MBH87023.1 hypothetical protein [Alteromonadaceae bacterium]MDG5500907.1 DUF2333 family protein [Marinobacter sp. BGYM27]|tara:strand:+ start:327 stop:1367 length:1041 start_codon:yes stop_codon:yes gene_type:complete